MDRITYRGGGSAVRAGVFGKGVSGRRRELDVCRVLVRVLRNRRQAAGRACAGPGTSAAAGLDALCRPRHIVLLRAGCKRAGAARLSPPRREVRDRRRRAAGARSEGGRVGQGWVGPFEYRWWPCKSK